jgi:peptidoglycan-associated lipoprotein
LDSRTDINTVTPYTNLPTNTDGTIPPTGDFDPSKWDENPAFFKANTVYFDYDRAAVRAGERVRVEEVAAYLKGKPGHMVKIEGHCDERGTEEYNRALGERRALAVREYLVNLGIQPERVHTISFGEDRPAEIGSSEGAWAKNRRGEFILLTPRQ